jgi:hypothetical protein
MHQRGGTAAGPTLHRGVQPPSPKQTRYGSSPPPQVVQPSSAKQTRTGLPHRWGGNAAEAYSPQVQPPSPKQTPDYRASPACPTCPSRMTSDANTDRHGRCREETNLGRDPTKKLGSGTLHGDPTHQERRSACASSKMRCRCTSSARCRSRTSRGQCRHPRPSWPAPSEPL